MCVVSGVSTITEFVPTKYHYDLYRAPDIADYGSWVFGPEGNRLPLPAMASDLVSINAITINDYNTREGFTQPRLPPTTTGENAETLYIFNAGDDSQYVTFAVTGVVANPDVADYWDYSIDNFEQFGSDWMLTPLIDFGFNVEGEETSVEETTNRTVWAEIIERGSTAGFLALSGALTEAAQETAAFRVRWDVDLAIGTSITDDLGREWTITSSASEADRRWLTYDAFRVLATT